VPIRLAALATALLLSFATATAGHPHVVEVNGPLADLRPQLADPTDGATASVLAVRVAGRTVTILHLRGLDRSAAGRTFGAHAHVGPCLPGDGPADRGPRAADRPGRRGGPAAGLHRGAVLMGAALGSRLRDRG
jgi:hypothetical protein